jgi:type IV pilus assembly protein PilM
VGPKGPGWVIQIVGYHFHNEDRHKPEEAEQFVRSTLVQSLLGKGDEVLVSAGPLAGKRVPVADLGIGYPIIMESSTVRRVRIQKSKPTATAGDAGAPPAAGDAETIELKRYDFTLQFAWQPTTPGIPKPPPPPEPAAQ